MRVGASEWNKLDQRQLKGFRALVKRMVNTSTISRPALSHTATQPQDAPAAHLKQHVTTPTVCCACCSSSSCCCFYCLPTRGVAKFERYCAEHGVEGIDFDVLSRLYEDPNNLGALPTDKLKLLARSMIQETMDER